MKKGRATEYARNNDMDEIYSSIPDYHTAEKLDFITLSIRRDDQMKQIFCFLEANGFKAVSDLKLEKGNYDMKRTFKSNADTASIEIMHGLKNPLPRYPSLLMKIHDPNKELLYLIDSFFKYHDIEPKVSVIEMTFDFHTNAPMTLFTFLNSHLFLRNVRTTPNRGYATTFYTNNIRKDAKGMRTYVKKLSKNDTVVRMELVVKRATIRKMGLEFPLSNIDSVDLSKFFLFKFVNAQRMKEYLYWKNKDEIMRAERRKRMGYDGSLVEAHINSLVDSIVNRDDFLMENIAALKSNKGTVPNYSRFMEPLVCFNSDFFKIASLSHFIPDKPRSSFVLAYGLKNTPVSLKMIK